MLTVAFNTFNVGFLDFFFQAFDSGLCYNRGRGRMELRDLEQKTVICSLFIYVVKLLFF